MSHDLGGFREMIAPGAFSDALAPESDVLMLRDHNPGILLGRTKSGTLKLVDGKDGLQFSCAMPKTSQARDLSESIDRGDLDGNSFGFVTLDDSWAADESGNVVRTLKRVDLFEISPCSFPAYPATRVDVRGLAVPAELRSRIAKRSEDDEAEEANDNGCYCGCPECVEDNCDNCSDPECDDPNCTANQRSLREADENRRMRLRLALAD